MTMKTVTVPLENRSYDILIGEDLISNFPIYLETHLSRKFLAIVTDKNVENLHLSKLVKVLSKAGIETEFWQSILEKAANLGKLFK